MNRRTVLKATGGLVTVSGGLTAYDVFIAEEPVPCVDTQQEGTRATYGPDDAPTVEIYEDFECPACKRYSESELPTLKEEADKGSLQLKFIHYPIPVGDLSVSAARIGMFLSSEGGDFWQYAREVYANQDDLSKQTLINSAVEAGAERNAVQNEADGSHYCDAVATDKEYGSDNGVEGTPTVIIGDELLEAPSANTVFEEVASHPDAGNGTTTRQGSDGTDTCHSSCESGIRAPQQRPTL